MAIKVSEKFKSEFMSYLRSVGVATIAVLLGSIAAPIFKWIDPTYKNIGINSDK